MKNSGHRLGASGTTAENTLEGYRESSAKPGMRGFRYWELSLIHILTLPTIYSV